MTRRLERVVAVALFGAAACSNAPAPEAGGGLSGVLVLVRERKVRELVGPSLDHYEASGVAARGGQLFVAFDNASALAAVDAGLGGGALGGDPGGDSQLEGLAFDPEGGGRFYGVTEAGGSFGAGAQIVEFDAAGAFVSSARVDVAFADDNFGFEGLASLRSGGEHYLLALCQKGGCGEGDGGQIRVLRREGEAWAAAGALAVPAGADFDDYSDLALFDEGGEIRAAIVSASAARVWLGALDREPLGLRGPGVVYDLPRGPGGAKYCTIEGVTFLDGRTLAMASDRSDGSDACKATDESVHVFALP
jgi:hypothetical protein